MLELGDGHGVGNGVGVGTSTTTSFTDFPLAQNTAYLYVVHARIGTAESGDSPRDFATTVMFDGLQPAIRAVDVTSLRTAVRALRSLAALPPFAFTDPDDNTLPGLAAKGIHIQQLREAVNQARTTLGFPAVTFTDPNVDPATNGGQHLPIRSVHITELRGAVQ